MFGVGRRSRCGSDAPLRGCRAAGRDPRTRRRRDRCPGYTVMSWHWFGPVGGPACRGRRASSRRGCGSAAAPAAPAGSARCAGAAAPRQDAAPRRLRRTAGRARCAAAGAPARPPRPAAGTALRRVLRRALRSGLRRRDRKILKMRGELTIAAFAGIRERHLDHFEPEARRVRIVRYRRPRSPAARRPNGRATCPTRRCRRCPCRPAASPPCACAIHGTSARSSRASAPTCPRCRRCGCRARDPCSPDRARRRSRSPCGCRSLPTT